MAGGPGLRDALMAIKTVYGDEEGGEINQGLFIGLMKQYQMGSEAKRLNRLPDDWMIKMLETAKQVCPSATLIHTATKKQWQHANGVGWDAPVLGRTDALVIKILAKNLSGAPSSFWRADLSAAPRSFCAVNRLWARGAVPPAPRRLFRGVGLAPRK